MSLVDEGDGVEVAWEDQQRINTFSKLNNRLSDIQDLLKAKQEEKEYYDDLSTELELADEDDNQPILYKMGEAFFYLDLKAARRQLKADMRRYAKFGKQINLETNP
ncbi:hypothetical protein CI109_101586 [Kwoniella shandongensis]|uniref:Prefoldin subunit 4 n=1 Tax=Kwoniella shandongensis TaxID=1734106 RepID=A0AAJ8LG16_9TREE